MPDPKSPLAQASIDLFNVTLLISGVILLGVAGVLLYSIFRFRARSATEEVPKILGNRRLEIAWTLGPAAILAAIAVFVIPTLAMQDVDSSKAGNAGQAPDIIVTGHQWWWEIFYPAAKVVTANEIHLPVGKRVLVQLESADVVHSLWLPQLGPKMDNVPGVTNWMWLQADQPGTYAGACSEYCGGPHAWMLLRGVAQTQADYDAWLRAQAAAPAPPTGDAARGAQEFQQHTCISCHAIAGVGDANAGPNLTHFGSRGVLASGELENNAGNVARWLRDPQQVKPGNRMPNLHLTDQEIHDLTAYMESLK